VAIAAVVVTVAASVFAVVVATALRTGEEWQRAERQRAIRETPNYGYDPNSGLQVVRETEPAEAAEAARTRLEAELARERASKALLGDFPDYHTPSKGEHEMLLRERATPADADDPLLGLDSL